MKWLAVMPAIFMGNSKGVGFVQAILALLKDGIIYFFI